MSLRERFEAWAQNEKGYSVTRVGSQPYPGIVEFWWQAWQAGARMALDEAAREYEQAPTPAAGYMAIRALRAGLGEG